jgi:hypothetical protein
MSPYQPSSAPRDVQEQVGAERPEAKPVGAKGGPRRLRRNHGVERAAKHQDQVLGLRPCLLAQEAAGQPEGRAADMRDWEESVGDGDEHLLGDAQKLTQQAFPVGEAADMLEDGVGDREAEDPSAEDSRPLAVARTCRTRG